MELGRRRRLPCAALIAAATSVLTVLGCTSQGAARSGGLPPEPTFEHKIDEIVQEMRRCEQQALANPAANQSAEHNPPATVPASKPSLDAQRKRALTRCEQNARQKFKLLVESETADYERSAEQERSFNALVNELSVSRPH